MAAHRACALPVLYSCGIKDLENAAWERGPRPANRRAQYWMRSSITLVGAARACYPYAMARAPLTDYEKYIRTEELLALQKTQLTCHDELQFQIVHQVAELWMKLIEHE